VRPDPTIVKRRESAGVLVRITRLGLGPLVEIQFSARSDLMIVDVAHLREGVADGTIDVGFLVVPSALDVIAALVWLQVLFFETLDNYVAVPELHADPVPSGSLAHVKRRAAAAEWV